MTAIVASSGSTRHLHPVDRMRLFLILLLLGFSSRVQAETTSIVEPGVWVEDRWTSEDGLPGIQLTALVTDHRGDLWLGSFGGLIRFDGAHFERYRRSDWPALPSNRIVDLAVHGETLWIITELGHLLSLTDGELRLREGQADDHGTRRFARLGGALFELGADGLGRLDGSDREVLWDGGVVVSLIGAKGSLWVGTVDGVVQGLDAGSRWVEHRLPVDVDWGGGLVEGPGGSILNNTNQGVWQLTNGTWAHATPLSGEVLTRLWSAQAVPGHGAVYCTPVGFQWVEPESASWPLPPPARACGLVQDQAPLSQGFWFADEKLRREGAAFPLSAAAASEKLGAVYEDETGDVWMTQGGDLLRYRQPLAAGARVLGAAGSGPITGLLADSTGGVWAGVGGGLARVEGPGDHAATVLPGDGYERRRILPLGFGGDGELWVGREHVCVLGDDGCVAPDDPTLDGFADRVWAMEPTADGQVWASTRRTLRRGRLSEPWATWTELTPPTDLPHQWHHLTTAPDGALLAASIGGGLLRIVGDDVQVLDERGGLSSNQVHHVYVDPRNIAWVSTQDSGVCRLDLNRGFGGEALACFDERHGLPVDSVQAIAEDGHERLWMNTAVGLLVVPRGDLDAIAAGERDRTEPFWLDQRDGLLGQHPSAQFQPAAVRDAGGRLWFAQWEGLAVVDADQVPTPAPPVVVIDGVDVGGEPATQAGGLELDSDQRHVRVRFHVIEMLRSDQVRVRYRLGADARWTGLGTAREIRFTELAAGDRTLEISAGLAGNWSEPARLQILRQPTFRESGAFPLAVGLFVGALVAGVGLVRRRSLRARARRLETAVHARTAELAESNQEVVRQSEELADRNERLLVQAARLDEVGKMRAKLIANLSHELRTPLSLVVGPLEQLAERLEGSGTDVERWLALLRRNGDRLTTLVDQLLDVARLERGEVMLRARHLDLATFVRTTVERFEPAVESRGLELSTHLGFDAAPAWFDPDLVDKVITNLVGNAMKYTRQGKIQVRLESEGDYLRVEVRDTGSGIAREEQARLFERFYQVEGEDENPFGGVGIGLSLARDLVELHGGDIGVESELGEGSAFWFRLPAGSQHLGPDDILAEANEEEAEPPGILPVTTAEDPDSELPLAILAEDSPDLRAFIADYLERGFRVVAVPNGEAALQAVAEERPAVVVSDVMMPKMDGLELCRRLRADPETADLPVVLVSAKVSPRDVQAGIEIATDYLKKPFYMGELLERVSAAAGLPMSAAPVVSEADREFSERLFTLLDERLADTDFSVEHMARSLAFSRRQLLRQVRRLTGASPSDLLRGRRLSRAQDLIKRGAHSSVTEVAAAVGLRPSYLSRLYKAQYGVSPKDELGGR
jgi:signal transduction histidine kinase/DNA-binding response OmpR family regulator/ligand-binding sensor domain-containing protein